MAAAPSSSARHAIGVRSRVRAAAVILVALASFSALSAFAWAHRAGPGSAQATPYALDAVAWRSVLIVASTAHASCRQSEPVVVLYVTRDCPHCRAELSRWADLVRQAQPSLRCTAVVTVAVPVRGNQSAAWLPAELAANLLWDHDGSIGTALDARLVPLAAFVTRTGMVAERAIGEQSVSSTLSRLDHLQRISNDTAPVR